MDQTICHSLSRLGSRELAGPDRATRLARHHLSMKRKTWHLTTSQAIHLCYEILLCLVFLHDHKCTSTTSRKRIPLAAVGFPGAGLTRWRRHHWHHRAYRLCRLALALAHRGGGSSSSGGGAPTPAWMVSIPGLAPLAEEMAICCDMRQSCSWPRQDAVGPLQQMIMEVARTASALGTVVVVKWRHSEFVFAPPLATTTIRNVDVVSTFWNNVSSMLVSTTTGDVLLPLLRCDALGIHRRLLGQGPGRDIRVLLKEFEEDFGDDEEGEEDEYAHEIALYMLELEAKCMPGGDMSRMTDPDLIDKRLEGIQEIEYVWGFLHGWLEYTQETYWVAVNIFDRYFAKSMDSDTMTYNKCYLLARAALFIASKYMEVTTCDLPTFVQVRNSDIPASALQRCETQALKTLEFEVYGGCSPWFWLNRGGRRLREGGGLAEAVENFLVQLAMRDYRFCGVRPNMVAAVTIHTISEMGLVELECEKRRDRVLWSRCNEGEVRRGFEMLIEGLRGDLNEDWLYEWHKREPRKGASEFAVRWAKVYGTGSRVDS